MSATARMQNASGRLGDLQQRGAHGGAALRVPIFAERDVVCARREARAFAIQLGFCTSEVTAIVAVISELTRTVAAETSEGALVLRRALREPAAT